MSTKEDDAWILPSQILKKRKRTLIKKLSATAKATCSNGASANIVEHIDADNL